MRVLNAAQMRDADRQTIEEIGIPSMVLMENAGRQVVAALEAGNDDLSDQSCRRAVRSWQQRWRRLRRRPHAASARDRRLRVCLRHHGRHQGRCQAESRDSRAAWTDGRRDFRRTGVGSSFLRDLPVRPHRRRDFRHGPQVSARRHDGDGGRRRERVGHTRGRRRSAERYVGRSRRSPSANVFTPA